MHAMSEHLAQQYIYYVVCDVRLKSKTIKCSIMLYIMRLAEPRVLIQSMQVRRYMTRSYLRWLSIIVNERCARAPTLHEMDI